MKKNRIYVIVLVLVFSLLSAAVSFADTDLSSSVDPSDPSDPVGGKWSITSIEKPYPCFVNGTIKREDLSGRLPGTVAVTVERPAGQTEKREAAVEWNMKNIPSVVDVGKAFVINGTVSDPDLEADGITGGNHGVSINVITAPAGPISTLRGKARIVTDLETELELYLICPESATGFFIEYSTDHQEWKAYRNGTDLWPELADPETKKIPPANIKANGEIKMSYRLEITRAKAAAGFWVRVRLEGSDHEGTSNECYFTPKDKSGESTWKPGGTASGGGMAGGGEAGLSVGEGQEESQSESIDETEPSTGEEETRRRRKSSGDSPSEEPTEEPTEPTEPSGENPRNGEGGYAAGGMYYGGSYGGWGEDDSMEEAKTDMPVLTKAAIAAAVIGGISLAGCLVYKIFTREH